MSGQEVGASTGRVALGLSRALDHILLLSCTMSNAPGAPPVTQSKTHVRNAITAIQNKGPIVRRRSRGAALARRVASGTATPRATCSSELIGSSLSAANDRLHTACHGGREHGVDPGASGQRRQSDRSLASTPLVASAEAQRLGVEHEGAPSVASDAGWLGMASCDAIPPPRRELPPTRGSRSPSLPLPVEASSSLRSQAVVEEGVVSRARSAARDLAQSPDIGLPAAPRGRPTLTPPSPPTHPSFALLE